jgi:parallel beta helix pectate lyase-like protein
MQVRQRRYSRCVVLAGLMLAAAALSAAPAAAATATLYVSPGGSDANPCTSASPCKTIGHAVSAASSGDRIVVRGGTYAEMVTIPVTLHLVGRHRPTIDATGQQNGVVIAGAAASGSSLRGFKIEHATQEGVVAVQTSWVTIAGNLVAGNDQGMFSSSPTGECAPFGQVPGDCGEGIHLMTVSHSRVLANRVTGNAGGVLLTDELGPTHDNVVGWNRIWRNAYDCGITVPGHNPNAVSPTGVPQPAMAGDYHNWIVHNVVNRNGLKGEGAGILFAGAGPGTGSYDNFVGWNTVNGNELAGITVHSHAPNTDVNGNRFVGNWARHDNVGGDPDAAVTKTTDILVFSAGDPITGTVARGNHLSDAFFGIWTLNAHTMLAHNHFDGVAVHVHQG